VLLGDPAVRLATVPAPADGVVTRRVPVTAGTTDRATGKPAEQTPQSTTLAPARTDPIEIATYVTDDPDGVEYEPATGRINGARLRLFSSVDLDGTAAHVTTTQSRGGESDDALTTLHTRLLEISIAARRATRQDSGGSP